MSYSFFSVIYLGMLGGACALGASHFLGYGLMWEIVPVSFGLIASIYFLNKHSDLKEDFINGKSSKKDLLGPIGNLWKGLAIGGVTLSYLIATERLSFYIIGLVSLGVLYSYTLFPVITRHGFHFVKMKRIPLVKNLIVALLWSISIIVVPAALARHPIVWTSQLVVMVIAFFLSSFLNTLLNDMIDVVGDRLAGIRTLPVIDPEGAEVLYAGILFPSLLILGPISYHYSWVSLGASYMIGLLAFIGACNFLAYKAKSFPKQYLRAFSEADLAIIAVGLFVI